MTRKGKRFSKEKMLAHMRERVEMIEKRSGFDRGKGSAQVENSQPFRVIEYGKYCALLTLIREIVEGEL